MVNSDLLKKIVSHCKEYGFIFPSSEIYDGLNAVYDYGPNGVELKNNIKEYWWKSMVQMNSNIVGLDSSIFMHPTIWKASGHLDAFNDPLIDNKDSKKRYRADVLIEDYVDRIRQKIEKEITKAKKRFGSNFNLSQFKQTNPRVLAYNEKIKEILNKMTSALEKENMLEIKDLIENLGISCPVSGSKNWTDVRQFNLMFGTRLGSVANDASELYLRPETAQGIFVNFLNVQKSCRMKIPFGIAQTGKAFRNEIVARQFIFRMREFEQMEMQFFVKPGEEIEWYNYWKKSRLEWHANLGFGEKMYRFHDHEKLAHYANAACDIEFKFPMGFKELEGIHSRTDFDLQKHQEYSKKKLQYFDAELNKNYVPYVVETSIGLDRMFLAVLTASYSEEVVDNNTRLVLKIPSKLAPVKACVLPLVRKDGLDNLAIDIYNKIKQSTTCQYDEKDSVGKRYRRQDAIGTPFCITVDHESKKDNHVTLRERDSMKQQRIPVEEISLFIQKKIF